MCFPTGHVPSPSKVVGCGGTQGFDPEHRFEPSPEHYGLRPLDFPLLVPAEYLLMDDQEYRENITVQYCFPENNASCIKESKDDTGYFFLCFFLSCVSVCTVFLNLLVIISISHFKQLHTPTNLIILSLAVADFLVGMFYMPADIMQLMDSCWYLGTIACFMSPIISFVAMYGSLYSLILIAVDRYIAITDPLQYSTRITVRKTLLSIILGWCFYLCYTILYLYFNDYFLQPQLSHCYGECILVVKYYWAIIDLVVAFLAPCCVILVLYSIIFKVARHQAKAISAMKNGASNKNGVTMLRSSEIKAAKKLGVVIFVYLACWIPYYISSVSVNNLTSSSMVWNVFGWLLDFNSSMNPLIYAIFYSWFKASVKYIVTCRIFETSSSRLNLFSEH
ncbi:trace amine-associated receptor 13c-like [Hoplias malabaricus]|uniref:trace amine-associated receptor 13c-like n=1 Tax=Hoplias malabaricus TaxID=27720 RepID=UPI0034618436